MNSPIFGTSAQPAGALPPRPVLVRKAAPRKSVPVFNPNAPKKSTSPQPNQLTPTVEQQLIIDGFQRGENMVISAAAGSGKTSSYIMLAEALHKSNPDGKGVYITFNKSMADEIGEKFFYRNVLASTIHSLANRGIRSNPQYAPLMDKLDGKRELMKPYDRPKVFGVPREVQFGVNPGPVHPKTNPLKVQYTGQTLCTQALLAVEKWCKSADLQIEPKHVIIRKSGKDAIGVPDEMRDRFKEYVADIATRMWDDDIMSVNGKLYYSHDYYLKLYQIIGADIPAQLNLGNRRAALFFDEAQDSRPCITDIVMQQRGKMQIVLCGDSSQAIYRFTGSMDAMRKFKEFKDFKPYLLSKTFRFGPQIAAIANQVLAQIIGSDVRVVPDYSINSTIEVVSGKSPLPTDANGDVPSAVIFRTNQQLIVSIINLLKSGYRVFAHTNVDMIKQVAEDYLALMHWDKSREPKPKMKHSGMWQFKSIDDIKYTLMKRAQERDAPLLPDNFFIEIPPEEEDTSDVEIEETLIPILTAIADHGPEDIIAAMESMETSESDADVVLSTIHKSKGRQWDSVLMDWTGDAIPKAKTHTAANDELMLFYVGATRAKRKLIIPTEVFVNLTIMNPSYKFADIPNLLPEFSAPDERELIELAYTMHPEYPMEGVRELVTDKAKQHELVHAISEITDTFLHAVPRTDRALLSTAVLSEVGMPAYMEASETAEMGFPQELFAAMLMVRGVTRHVDAVNVILEKEDS